MKTSPLRPIHLIALVVGLLLGAIGFWLGRSPAPPSSPPRAPMLLATPPATPPSATVHQIVFALSPQKPTGSPDMLPSGASAVYAFYTIPGMNGAGAPGVVWRRNGLPIDRAASQVEVDKQRPGHGVVTFRPPGGKLAPGIYEVEVKTELRTYKASFVAARGAAQILSQPVPAEALLTVPQFGTCRGITARGEPANQTDAFAPTEKIYFALRYTGAEPGTAVTVSWWSGRTELVQGRREVTLPSAAGWAHAWIQVAQGLPAGVYRVEAAVSGGAQQLASAEFHIR